MNIEIIKTKAIIKNPYQPRTINIELNLDELISDISKNGLLQPIQVMRKFNNTEEASNLSYILISGQRRLLAMEKLGKTEIAANIVPFEKDYDKTILVNSFSENNKREDFHFIDESEAIYRIANKIYKLEIINSEWSNPTDKSFNDICESLASDLSLSKSFIKQRLIFVKDKLSNPTIREYILNNNLSFTKARDFKIEQLVTVVTTENLNVTFDQENFINQIEWGDKNSPSTYFGIELPGIKLSKSKKKFSKELSKLSKEELIVLENMIKELFIKEIRKEIREKSFEI